MEKIIAKNPTAYHNYSIESTIEGGIDLTGTEIKSIRNGKVNIKDTYVNIKNGEVWVYGMSPRCGLCLFFPSSTTFIFKRKTRKTAYV